MSVYSLSLLSSAGPPLRIHLHFLVNSPSDPSNGSSLLLPSLLTPEFLNGLLEAVQTTRSERVIENGLYLFARLLWKEVPTGNSRGN